MVTGLILSSLFLRASKGVLFLFPVRTFRFGKRALIFFAIRSMPVFMGSVILILPGCFVLSVRILCIIIGFCKASRIIEKDTLVDQFLQILNMQDKLIRHPAFLPIRGVAGHDLVIDIVLIEDFL